MSDTPKFKDTDSFTHRPSTGGYNHHGSKSATDLATDYNKESDPIKREKMFQEYLAQNKVNQS